MKRSVSYLATFATLAITAISGVTLSSNTSAADSVIDTVTATLNTSCTMNGSTTSAHTATISNGINTPDIGTTNLTVTCNDAGGFGIYAIGFSNDTEGNTNMLSSAGDTYNIATGTATSGPTSNWAMKVAPGTGITSKNDFNSYHAVPTTYTRVAEKTSGVELGTTTSASTTYQIYASNTQPAGTYTGKVKYVLVHPSSEQCPEGYTLEGGVCKKPVFSGITTMQQMTPEICSAETTPSASSTDVPTKQLKDTRDNKLYWVSKLADGNCWMTQNLDYDIKASGNEAAVIGRTTTTWDSPDGATSTTLTSNSSYTGTASWDPGDYYVENGGGASACSTWRPTSDCQSTKATVSLTSAAAKDNTNLHYHLGNYYQWNAATAGTGGTASNKDVDGSICPKGWRLPTSNSTTNNYSFGKLTTAYSISSNATGATALISSPLWFVRAGLVNGGSLRDQGSYGYVWSSRAYSNANYAYFLDFGSTYVSPSNRNDRYVGFSVRCVAE